MQEEENRFPEEYQTFIRDIHENSEKLLHYINDLMLITTIESTPEIRPDNLSLDRVVKEILDKQAQKIDEKNLQVNVQINPGLIIFADRALFEKALYNVIKNAIDYNRQEGSVTICAKVVAEIVEILVKDTGIGIPDSCLEDIFDKFYRVDTSITYRVSGVGVGLFLVRRILELHGGNVTVQSEIGTGSCFTLLLPKS